jgi:ABC-type branched-subunit amino acid transport system ATPase component
VSIDVQEGSITAIIGPNGAGKTTLFNIVAGFLPPTAGHVWFEDADITGVPPHRLVRIGVARTFQNIRLFQGMSVLENVLIGEHAQLRSSPWQGVVGWPSTRREERAAVQRAHELLARVGLSAHADSFAGSLPYGAQRRLEIARAWASGPRLLLLDEPAAGANPHETDKIAELVADIRVAGTTVLLIEHDMRLVMNLSDTMFVLDHGRVIATGSPSDVRAVPEVIEAYLGSSDAQEPLRALGGATGADAELVVEDLHVSYGAIAAVRGITLNIRQGELVSLVGSNGAGKSTTLKAIAGIVRSKRGRISLFGRDATRLPAHEIVRSGVASVPEGRQVFARMSVEDNLLMGGYQSERRSLAARLEEAYRLFPLLRERRHQHAGTLSGGEQQMLAIARGLMSHPRLLMLDEPSMGLAPILVRQVFSVIQKIHSEGRSILLVEQNAAMALAIANRGYVLQTGEVELTGSGAELAADSRVREAYLGG